MFSSRNPDSIYNPLLAYSEDEKNSKDKILNIWDTFDALPETSKQKISSEKTVSILKRISRDNMLSELQSINLSRLVRKYYFNELDLKSFSTLLKKELDIEESIAEKISSDIIQKIINDSSIEESTKPKTEKFALLDAIRVYPEINEQLITSQPIRLKNYPEAVRPSIKNWIADYTFQLGYEHHDSIARGNFIFKSENGKNLTPNDRGRLSEILKSFDEKTPLEVDTLAKQIVFSPSQEKNISEKPVLSPSHPNENPSFTVDLREKTASVPTAEKTESLPRKETFSFSSAPKEIPSSFHRDMPNQMVLSRKPEEKNVTQTQSQKAFFAPKEAPGNNLSFSSPQKLPVEKNDAPIQDQKTVSNEPQITPQPMRIRPVSNNGNNLWKREIPPENVINLKE